MERYVKNAYRVLGLAVAAGVDEARARAAELGTDEARAAASRLDDARSRARERLFAPGDDERGRCVAAHAALIEARSRDAAAWRAAVTSWRDLARLGALRAVVEDDELLAKLDSDLLEVNVALGAQALQGGDEAAARVHADLLRTELREPKPALERLLAPAAQAVVAEAQALQHPLDDLELGNGMNAAQKARSTQAADAAAAGIDALARRAGALRSWDLPPAHAASDQVALVCLRLAIVSSWIDRMPDTSRWLERASTLACTEPLRRKIASDRASLRTGEELKPVFEARAAGKPERARRILRRKRASADAELRARIDAMLADPRQLLAPVRSAPALFRLNGCGVGLYGSRDAAQDGTYVTTWCLCFVFFPVLPISAFLVRREGRGWRFYGKVPLSGLARTIQRTILAAVLLGGLWIFGAAYWESSPWVRDWRTLAAARSALDAQRYGEAAIRVKSLYRSATEQAGAIEVATAALRGSLEGVKDAASAAAFTQGAGSSLRSAPPAVYTKENLALLVAAAERTRSLALVDWGRAASPAFHEQSLPLARKLAEGADDATLLAAVLRWHREDKAACPPEIVERLGERLLARRDAGWSEAALEYLAAAPPAEARAVLYARAERAWKGSEGGAELAPFAAGTPLGALLAADKVEDLAARARALEAAADPGDLPGPQATWHRIGVARRLSKVYADLHEQDPLRHPETPAREWAIKAAELCPADAAVCAPAMRYLVEAGEEARAIALGEGLGADRTDEATTWLGVALAHSDRLEEAAKVLRPYVDRSLAAYTESCEGYFRAVKAREQELYSSLRNGTADQSFISRLNSLPEARAQEEVHTWIEGQLAGDGSLAELRAKVRESSHVHAGAFELAMVEVRLGRAMTPGPERDAVFKRAERIFLSLRKVSSDDPAQDLQLGQVYFWLGKRAEGQALYDALEKKGEGQILYQMGEIYRFLGQSDDARRVLEAAYAKLPAGEREQAALTRGLEPKDPDDAIEWLSKGGSSEFARMSLAQVRGEKLLEEGDYAAAVPDLKAAAAFDARDPENAIGLHNASTAWALIHQATGDPNDLKEALRFSRLACDRTKDNAIALRNYADLLWAVGFGALAGDAVRADVIHVRPEWSWLDLVRPELSAADWAARIREQADLRRAVDVARRAAVVAPEAAEVYGLQAQFFSYVGDLASLKRLREDLESASLSRAESIDGSRRAQRGEIDPTEKRGYERALAAVERRVAAARSAQHAPTLALALVHEAGLLAGARYVVPERADSARAIALAEEAAQTFDASQAWATVAAMHGARALELLEQDDPGYKAAGDACRDLAGPCSLWLRSQRDAAFAAKVRAHPDVKAAAAATLRERKHPSSSVGLDEALWLLLAGDEGAADLQRALVARGTCLEMRRIDLVLSPQSNGALAEVIVAAHLFGDEATEKRMRELARERKLLGPFLGE